MYGLTGKSIGEAFTWQVAYLFHAVNGGRPTNDPIDYDEKLTMADVICALQMAVGLMEVDLNVDVTGDGRVTSGDANQILQMIP